MLVTTHTVPNRKVQDSVTDTLFSWDHFCAGFYCPPACLVLIGWLMLSDWILCLQGVWSLAFCDLKSKYSHHGWLPGANAEPLEAEHRAYDQLSGWHYLLQLKAAQHSLIRCFSLQITQTQETDRADCHKIQCFKKTEKQIISHFRLSFQWGSWD
jgi:hypothetical protein